MIRTVSLTFKTSRYLKYTLSIPSVDPFISDKDVNSLMDFIISKNIINTRGLTLVEKSSCIMESKNMKIFKIR